MERFLPKANDTWRHADGSLWIVIKTEVNEKRKLEVTIASLDYTFRIEKWDIDDFLDEVDHDNYPDCRQDHIFAFLKAEQER